MAFSPKQCEDANSAQLNAARDPAPQIRLVAGPGSGKSRAIEARVCWLLENGVDPNSIFVVSFTRAASRDLKERIEEFCSKSGHEDKSIRVSTLHSLALLILGEADALQAYPATPLVLDDWEVKNIFDDEFSTLHNITPTRCEEIRDFYQAYWDTDSYNHPLYVKPDEPVTNEEREWFEAYNNERTQLYSCILSGELVRKCVEQMNANVLDPTTLIGLRHLIVDEFQDLNPTDQKFIQLLAAKDITLFVAGDDDQSIYSFRYASPAGIQRFDKTYPLAKSHALNACFRCTPAVLNAAGTLIAAYSDTNRIKKNHFSLYDSSEPAVTGSFHRWQFNNGDDEAEAIARSCASLIEGGVQPRDILILLTNKVNLGKPVIDALGRNGVPSTPLRTSSFIDSKVGRFVYSIIRIVLQPDDYVAHRTILGVQTGVGAKTCNDIARRAIDNGLNFRNLFYNSLPDGVFSKLLGRRLAECWDICNSIKDWKDKDTLAERRDAIANLVNKAFGDEGLATWRSFSGLLPDGINLKKLREYLGADSDEKRAGVIRLVSEGLGSPAEELPTLPNRVQVMTMHSAKGLSAHVVFIPGLEEYSLPGEKRKPYPALVMEAARMLYVSITRARASCIVSYATNRLLHGKTQKLPVSRFAAKLNGNFEGRDGSGLRPDEASKILADCTDLF